MKGSRKTRITIFDGTNKTMRTDAVVLEEPLELRLEVARQRHTLTTTMRTPGHDFELAAGWCFAEGIIDNAEQIQKISYCVTNKLEQRFNIVNIKLQANVQVEISNFIRTSLSTSACGVCGKASLEALDMRCSPLENPLQISPQTLYDLPEKLRAEQVLFDFTGGNHAAALFSSQGVLLALREDIGRHNAVDKLIGWALLNAQPLEQTVLVVSGRAGFEIAQKAIAAQIPILASVSAPSSLAVEVAQKFGLTLVGFLRGQRMNVYSSAERITANEKP